MITDGYGNVVERSSYDTWGKQRAISWRSNSPAEVLQSAITNRGYTGHEEITEVNLIHMNGRVYDQQLGRFLSADPHIQAPYLVNSFNRYSYVMNNPLKYTDPTGFSWSETISSAWNSICSSVSSFFGGSSSSNSDNGNDPTRQQSDNDHGSSSSEEKSKVKETKARVIDDTEYADYAAGRYVSGNVPGEGELHTLRAREQVRQSLDVNIEKSIQGELPDTEITDTVSTLGVELGGLVAGKAGATAAEGLGIAIKSTETVKLLRLP